MRTVPKVLLIASSILFALSLTHLGGSFGWGILKPLSAILFMLFFIAHLFGPELAKYDEETSKRAVSVKSKRGVDEVSNAGGGSRLAGAAFK